MKYALDPLAHKLHKEFGKVQAKRVKTIEGMGEFLPISSRSFDFVILNNTIDHTDDPSSILKEIKRILKEDGVLYIGVNIYPLSIRIAAKYMRHSHF
jgi:ubiquinone/menaquinone biosynthesis C-methylase UbiE